jgi:hypothetical protein
LNLNKTDLLKTLRLISNFDVTGSPFIALQLGGNQPCFYRSSPNGFIQSQNLNVGKMTYVYLNHFKDCLQILKDDMVDLDLDLNGVLKLSANDSVYESELRIHTAKAEQAGLKHHDVGDVVIRLAHDTFNSFNTKSFSYVAQPVLDKGKILIPSQYGVIVWKGTDALNTIQLSPRDSFLRIASSPDVKEIVICKNGYWGAIFNDLMVFIGGHVSGKHLFELYDVPANLLGSVPADRLIYGLKSAVSLAGDNGKIEVCPINGVITKDQLGSQAKFTLGDKKTWNKFSLTSKAANMVVEALSQTKEDEIKLSQFTLNGFTVMRLTRGFWEVNFRVL